MRNISLPQGWSYANLEDICYIFKEHINPSVNPEQKFNYLSIENIESNTGNLVNFSPTFGKDIRSTKLAFTNNDILYSKLRPYLNKVYLPNFKGISATDLIPIRPKGDIPREYIAYFLRTHAVVEYANQRMRGIQLPRLPVEDLLSLRIPIPPLAEQKRIVAKIEDLIQELKTAKQALQKVPQLIKQFRQYALIAAFRGELTERVPNEEPATILLERTRKEHIDRCMEAPEFSSVGLEVLPDKWIWMPLGSVLELVQYGTSVKADSSKENGFPILRMGNIKDGYLDLSNLKYLDPSKEDISKYTLVKGDILINRTNSPELVGKSALFNVNDLYVFASYLIRLRANQSVVVPEFLNYLINSLYGRRYIYGVKHQVAGQANINTKDIKSMPVPLPPLNEQRRIVEKVEQFFEYALTIESVVQTVSQLVDSVEQSILDKVFRGELVLQDPNDEPASILLENIKRNYIANIQIKIRRKKTRPPKIQLKSIPDILKEMGEATVEQVFQASGLNISDFWDKLKLEINEGRIERIQKGGSVFLKVKD